LPNPPHATLDELPYSRRMQTDRSGGNSVGLAARLFRGKVKMRGLVSNRMLRHGGGGRGSSSPPLFYVAWFSTPRGETATPESAPRSCGLRAKCTGANDTRTYTCVLECPQGRGAEWVRRLLVRLRPHVGKFTPRRTTSRYFREASRARRSMSRGAMPRSCNSLGESLIRRRSVLRYRRA
jgi:hypothetical protein